MNPPAKKQSQEAHWLKAARAVIGDLTHPAPWIYWCDYTLSIVIGYTAGVIYLLRPFGTPLSLVCMLITALATYRAAMFLHELVHFRKGEMEAFKRYWNLTGGIIMLMPSFLYECHLDHHSSHHYGTEEDGEYLPLGNGTWSGIVSFLSQSLFLPIFVYLRFLIGTPLSYLFPSIRPWVVEHASSFVINFRYRRHVPEQLSSREWWFLEWACCLRAAAPIVAISVGAVPWTQLPKLYLVAVVAITINHVRTLAAHRYRSDGRPMAHHEQFLDSTNIRGNWLTELLCPVGLRYHALHHLFPAIPYHRLGVAHRRLMQELPDDSRYRETECPSVVAALTDLAQSLRRPAQTSPSQGA